jgi:acetoin utilization protein AcuC
VVPRTWTHLLAEAAGEPIDPAAPTPGEWREHVERRTGRQAPEQMTEGSPGEYVPFESGFDPGDPVDRAILATQRVIFPAHGMFPPF